MKSSDSQKLFENYLDSKSKEDNKNSSESKSEFSRLERAEYPVDIQILLNRGFRFYESWPSKYIAKFDKIREMMGKLNNSNMKRSEKDYIKKWLSVEVAALCISGVKFKTVMGTEEILFYNSSKGIFEKGGKNIIRQICRRVDYTCSMRFISEVIDKVKVETFEFRENFDPNLYLAVLNGVFNLRDLSFHEHSHEYLLTKRIPVKYDPNAFPEKIIHFITEIVQPDDIDIIFEIIGWCFMKDYPIHKIFIFTGSGSNGKTTLLNLVTTFLGKENVSHIPFQNIRISIFSDKLVFKFYYLDSSPDCI